MAGFATERTSSEPLLLNDRLALFGLTPASIENARPTTVQGLRAVCVSCSLKARCRDDLASEQRSADVAANCPNEPTLQKLRSAQ